MFDKFKSEFDEPIKEPSLIDETNYYERRALFERLVPKAIEGKIYENHKYLICTPYSGIIPVVFEGVYSLEGRKEVKVRRLDSGRLERFPTVDHRSKWILLYHDTVLDLI